MTTATLGSRMAEKAQDMALLGTMTMQGILSTLDMAGCMKFSAGPGPKLPWSQTCLSFQKGSKGKAEGSQR